MQRLWVFPSVLLLGFAAGARADLMTYNFQGVDAFDPAHPFAVQGTLRYDTNARLLSQTGSGSKFSTAGEITLQLGGQYFSTDPKRPLLATLTAGSVTFNNAAGGREYLQLQIGEGKSTLFPDLSSLPSQLSLPQTGGSFRVVAHLGDPWFMNEGDLTGLSPLVVPLLRPDAQAPPAAPEPASLLLFGVGAAALPLWARRAMRTATPGGRGGPAETAPTVRRPASAARRVRSFSC